MSILELLQEIKILLIEPNYDSCVDLARDQIKNDINAIQRKVKEWNDRNGKNFPEEWEKEWKIQSDGKLFDFGKSKVSIVPEEYLCHINRKIMKEPVKASSGVYYEKASLENYLKTTPKPTCKARVDKNGKEIPLPIDINLNLKVDNEMKTKIAK